MRKKSFIIPAVLLCMLLSGCGKRINYDLPSDPVAFNMSQFVNPADKEDTYLSIELNGRTYVPYGTVENGRNQNFSKNGSDYIMINNGSGGYTLIPKSGSGYQQENFHSITQNESKFGF